jgi:AGCS family alanine or glycine:cation symporter
MIEYLFNSLEIFNNLLWGYIAIFLIFGMGLYLSFKSKWMQITQFPHIVRYFFHCLKIKEDPASQGHVRGVSPIRTFYASVGGCVGIGNLVTIGVAIQIGGPGALVWVWVIALLGMVVKYSEVFLGIKYRRPNDRGSYNGGPMYFLQKAFPGKTWIPLLMAALMCIYGVEIYMFRVMKESFVLNFSLPPTGVTIGLLALTIMGVSGGVARVGAISSFLIPTFVLVYLGMTIWVVSQHITELPNLIRVVVESAFSGHAALGGFIGSTLSLTIAKGISGACYSGDIGIGYASIIHSEVNTCDTQKQAGLSIFGIFLDTFVICTCTILLLLTTGVWHESMDGSMLVQTALGLYFPHMNIFMPIFLFALGYSTITAYLCAGLKCARFITPRYGAFIYYGYAGIAFIFFSFYEPMYALTIMNISGGLLMLINLAGIFKLRKEVDFNVNY